MSDETQHRELRASIKELEQLIARWENTGDPETRWAVYLLREALNLERQRLWLHEAKQLTKEAGANQ